MSAVPAIDALACVAYGDCVEIAPAVFALDDDVATVIGADQDDVILAAARACASTAIVVTDAATGERLYP